MIACLLHVAEPVLMTHCQGVGEVLVISDDRR